MQFIIEGELTLKQIAWKLGYINHILENDYLNDKKEMIVIDIAGPQSRLIDYYKTHVIQKSVSDLTIKEWLTL